MARLLPVAAVYLLKLAGRLDGTSHGRRLLGIMITNRTYILNSECENEREF